MCMCGRSHFYIGIGKMRCICICVLYVLCDDFCVRFSTDAAELVSFRICICFEFVCVCVYESFLVLYACLRACVVNAQMYA